MNTAFFRSAALTQASAVAAVILVAAMWPPRSGAMLMVPLSGRAVGAIDIALARGARLLGAGPLPGSVVVVGDRAALSSSAFAHGILLFSAPRAMCGAKDQPELRA